MRFLPLPPPRRQRTLPFPSAKALSRNDGLHVPDGAPRKTTSDHGRPAESFSRDSPVCDFEHALPQLDEDEYVLDTPFVREFVAAVRARIDKAASPSQACALIGPLFRELLA